jgi:cyclic dehypoxanthinyl futalosine synthase
MNNMSITRQEAIDCFGSDDLIGIGMEADALRHRLHPEGVVTYNCVIVIEADSPSGRTEAAPFSGTARLTSASSDLDALAKACATVRQSSPAAWIEPAFGGASLLGLDARSSVARLAEAGASSIFVDPRTETGDYARRQAAALELHRAAHELGMRTVATVAFGCGESIADRLDTIEAIRRLQDETGGFTASLPLGLEARAGRELDGVTAVERLKTVAITRMCLDNIPHLRSVQTGAGLKVLQTALRFGADDAELRLPQAGTTEPDLRRVIRDAGFRPVERDATYSTIYLS